MPQSDHPVWSVYDRLRSARLSVKYYCCRIESAERKSFWLELILLVTAPSSAVAGLWFWNNEYGQLAWKIMAIPAAIAAVLKPLLHLTKKIKDYEAVISGYRMLEHDLLELKIGIEQKRKYDTSLQTEFKRVQQRERILVGKNPEARGNPKVKAVCQAEVLRELPTELFFVPED